jgi:hypothetical protein
MLTEESLQKYRTNSWFLLHDKAPAHRLVFVKDVLAKKNKKTLKHHHIFLTWFQMIFSVSSTVISTEETALIGDTDITKNATEELKALSQDGLQEYLQNIYSS